MHAWYFSAANVLPNGDGRKIVIGETLTVTGDIIPCERGLHASVSAFDALQYAPGPLLWRVELGGTVVPDGPQPAPAPTPAPPAPTPAPTPTPTTPPEALVREVVAEVETLAKGAIAGIVTLVHRLGGSIPEWSGTEEAGPPA